MILTTERTPTNTERLADWYAKAVITQYPFLTGPRFSDDFDRVFARQYEAEQIADSAPSIGDER